MRCEPVVVELYTKEECALCRQMKTVIDRVRADYPLALREIDIGSDPLLLARYAEEVPVLFLDGRKAFKFRTSEAALRRRLALLMLGRRFIGMAAKRSDR